MRVEYSRSQWSLVAIFLSLASVNCHGEFGQSSEIVDQSRIRRRLRGITMATLPPLFSHSVSDVKDGFNTTSGDTPVFWKLSKTGSSISVQPYLADCLNLVVANEAGATLAERNNEVLQVVEMPSERRYLNIDTSTLQGLSNPKAKHLAQSGLADVVISPLLTGVLGLFDEHHKAKLFTIMRHPVERATSTFYHLKEQEKKSGATPLFQLMTLEQYANSNYVESNFIVRSLISKPSEAIMPNDMYMAKTILRQKFLIGLSTKMDESLDRIQRYFGWEAVDHYRLGVFQRIKDCKAQYLSKEHIAQQSVDHPILLEGSLEWNLLLEKNWADMALYESALDVFREQGISLFGPEVNKTLATALNHTNDVSGTKLSQ